MEIFGTPAPIWSKLDTFTSNCYRMTMRILVTVGFRTNEKWQQISLSWWWHVFDFSKATLRRRYLRDLLEVYLAHSTVTTNISDYNDWINFVENAFEKYLVYYTDNTCALSKTCATSTEAFKVKIWIYSLSFRF